MYRLKKGADYLNAAYSLFDLGRVYGKTAEHDKALVCIDKSLMNETTTCTFML